MFLLWQASQRAERIISEYVQNKAAQRKTKKRRKLLFYHHLISGLSISIRFVSRGVNEICRIGEKYDRNVIVDRFVTIVQIKYGYCEKGL